MKLLVGPLIIIISLIFFYKTWAAVKRGEITARGKIFQAERDPGTFWSNIVMTGLGAIFFLVTGILWIVLSLK